MTEETQAVPATAAQEDPARESSGETASGDGTTSATPRPRRRRRGGSGRSRSGTGGGGTGGGGTSSGGTRGPGTARSSAQKTAEPLASEPEPVDPERGGAAGSAEGTGTATAAKRRRRRRGGRGRGGAGAATSTTTTAEGDDAAAEAADGSAPPASEDPKPNSSNGGTEPSRPRRRRRSPAAASAAKTETKAKDAKTAEPKAERAKGEKAISEKSKSERAPATKPARRSRTTKKTETAEDQSGPTRTARRPRTPGTRRRREPPPLIKRERDKIMLITERGERDQIAVVEGRDLIEHYITRVGAHSMVGNIYLGRVQNVLPGMEAAFVDVGRGRNAVLYAGEVNWDEDVEGQARRIEQALKPGQSVLVQVTKDPLGGKGARLTGEISVPGRFLVLVPNSQVFGLSRRLPDNERRRLRAIVRKLKPDEHGVIVRTAADGASEEDLAADIERLLATWAEIEQRAKKAKPPKVLYEEPELTVRVVRDLFNDEEFTEIVTDSDPVYDMVRKYLQQVAPDLVENVHLHAGPLPLFEEYHLIEQIHKALERKVWLPSGGYIVIDRTEAMTVIDVNTGRHVGKTNLEETVVKTNTEAAEEIARQLRLRDIGGMILIDFIDMLFEQNKDKVVNTLKDALAQDKTRSQVFDISPLGLLEVTRKRVSAGLLESFSETCPTCEGRGILLTHDI